MSRQLCNHYSIDCLFDLMEIALPGGIEMFHSNSARKEGGNLRGIDLSECKKQGRALPTTSSSHLLSLFLEAATIMRY